VAKLNERLVALRSGDRREGPLVVEEALSTTLVPPGTSVTVDRTGSLIIHLKSSASDG
jgi:N-methylhydantoinase A